MSNSDAREDTGYNNPDQQLGNRVSAIDQLRRSSTRPVGASAETDHSAHSSVLRTSTVGELQITTLKHD